MNIPADILRFLDQVSRHTLPIASAMSAIGVLSMAIIQAVKDTSPVRHAFQKRFLREWLLRRDAGRFDSKGIRGFRDPYQNAPKPSANLRDVQLAEMDLIGLATGGDTAAFYDLAIEQLCGQMNAASQIVLEYPQSHPVLLRLLAAQALPEDVALVLSPPAFPTGNESTPEMIRYRDARNRTTHHIQRSIDGLQIAAGFRWKFYLQLLSFVTSFLIAALALLVANNSESFAAKFVMAVIVGVIAGFVAPVARDLVAALQNLRK